MECIREIQKRDLTHDSLFQLLQIRKEDLLRCLGLRHYGKESSPVDYYKFSVEILQKHKLEGVIALNVVYPEK